MSFLTWDTAASAGTPSLVLYQGPNPGCNTKPGEILALTSGSAVDLLDNVPPPAAETNFGSSISIPVTSPSYTTTSVQTYNFNLARGGWYEVVIPYVYGAVNAATYDEYDLTMFISQFIPPTTTKYIAGTNLTIAGTQKCQSGLKCKFFCDDISASTTYGVNLVMSGTNSVSNVLSGLTLTWGNIYIFPIVSGIDAIGNSPFVLLH